MSELMCVCGVWVREYSQTTKDEFNLPLSDHLMISALWHGSFNTHRQTDPAGPLCVLNSKLFYEQFGGGSD